MIWFKIKELEQLLIAGKVSDHLAFKYLLAQFILFTLLANIPGDDHDPIWSQGIHLIIALPALIYGLTKTYEVNKAGDNRDYFKRFFSLSLVAGIRLFVFIFIISAIVTTAILISNTFGISLRQYTFDSEVFELFNFLLFNIVYYYILISSFKRINSAGSGETVGVV